MNVKNVLINKGFKVILNNEFASSAAGGLSPFDTWPEVWLLNDKDLEEALMVVSSLTNDTISKTWDCKKCHEINDQTFEYCWKCSLDKPQDISFHKQ